MNAYELADWLEATWIRTSYKHKAALMLRQQAEKISNMEQWEKRYLDRIAELEKPVKQLSDEEIAKIYHSENRFSPQGNFAYYGFARAIIKEITE